MKSTFCVSAVLVSALVLHIGATGPDDWPQWRGRNRDGVGVEKGLLKTWPPNGPSRVWQANGAGEGYSSFAVAGGKLYTLGARAGTEYVMAFDEATGKKVWEVAHGRRFGNDRGDGPRGTPTVSDGTVYAYGASGDLSAHDAATGKQIWTVNVLQKFGGSNITWGLSESPLVLQDRIIVNAGGRGASVVALNRKDGSVLWQTLNPGTRRPSCTNSKACRRPLSSQRKAVSRLMYGTASGCGATIARRTRPPTSRRRSRAATKCFSLPTTAPAPASSSSPPPARGISPRRRSTSRAKCAITLRARC